MLTCFLLPQLEYQPISPGKIDAQLLTFYFRYILFDPFFLAMAIDVRHHKNTRSMKWMRGKRSSSWPDEKFMLFPPSKSLFVPLFHCSSSTLCFFCFVTSLFELFFFRFPKLFLFYFTSLRHDTQKKEPFLPGRLYRSAQRFDSMDLSVIEGLNTTTTWTNISHLAWMHRLAISSWFFSSSFIHFLFSIVHHSLAYHPPPTIISLSLWPSSSLSVFSFECRTQ